MMLQTALAVAPVSPSDTGILAAFLALVASVLVMLFSPAWVWAIYGLINGIVHCIAGYRFLTLCIVAEMIVFGGLVVVFIAAVQPPWLWSAFLLGGTAIFLTLAVVFYKCFPALFGFAWGMVIAGAVMTGVGMRPRFLYALPFGILGAWTMWKRARVAYIWLCATTGAGGILWSVITLVQTWAFGSFRVLKQLGHQAATGEKGILAHPEFL
jgi:hypothetical protein